MFRIRFATVACGVLLTGTALGAVSNGGGGTTTTQTVITNTTTNPVPTASVGITATRDVDRRPANRLTLFLSGADVSSLDPAGHASPIYGIPAGKVFIVSDVDVVANGQPGDVGIVDISHPGVSFDVSVLVTITKLGAAVERIHYTAGAVFSDLPGLGSSQNLGLVYVTLRGFLVDAQ